MTVQAGRRRVIFRTRQYRLLNTDPRRRTKSLENCSMSRKQTEFLFLNMGHFLDHLFMLIFATVAALALIKDWNTSYAALVVLATPGFIAFGLGALVAGWIADRWSRAGMMVVFFIGIGLASVATSFATSPTAMMAGLLVVGCFAAIYHPVGIAMVIEGRKKTGIPIAINGVFGNIGVASAALLTGYLIDQGGWQNAFRVPGVISIIIGCVYFWFINTPGSRAETAESLRNSAANPPATIDRQVLLKIVAIVLATTALGGLIFQSTTFALPKILDERLTDLSLSATLIGWYAFVVFTVAAFSQLVVGWMLDRYSLRYIFIAVALCQCVLFLVMIPLNGLIALLVATGFMLAVFGQIPINDVLIGRVARSEWRSRLLAVRYVVTFGVQASSLPLIAWIHTQWGFDRLFLVLAISAAIIFACVLLLPRSQMDMGMGAGVRQA